MRTGVGAAAAAAEEDAVGRDIKASVEFEMLIECQLEVRRDSLRRPLIGSLRGCVDLQLSHNKQPDLVEGVQFQNSVCNH